jgi:hypothetical protein
MTSSPISPKNKIKLIEYIPHLTNKKRDWKKILNLIDAGVDTPQKMIKKMGWTENKTYGLLHRMKKENKIYSINGVYKKVNNE